jgi:hypothetical protein
MSAVAKAAGEAAAAAAAAAATAAAAAAAAAPMQAMLPRKADFLPVDLRGTHVLGGDWAWYFDSKVACRVPPSCAIRLIN